MRPSTLADAVDRIQAGSARDVELAEFVDTFDLAKTDRDRYASIEREPMNLLRWWPSGSDWLRVLSRRIALGQFWPMVYRFA